MGSPYDNHGCNGGFQANAIRYVNMNGGIMNWDDYPYVSGTTKTEGTCVYDATNANLNVVNGCGKPASGDEDDLMNAIAQKGPLTIAIDAGGLGFQLYTSGVYSSTTCGNAQNQLNHAVTATGYGMWMDG